MEDAGGLSSSRYYAPTRISPRVAERSGYRKAAGRRSRRSYSQGRRGQVSQSYRGGGYRGGGGGGGGGNQYRESSGGQRGGVGPRSVPGGGAGAVPNINKYLAGDVDYQNFLRGNKRTLGDFMNDLTRQRTEAGTTFATSKRQMQTEREEALQAMKDEFASRGLLTSGLYGEAQGDYNRDWTTQMGTLEQANAAFLADLLSQQTNFSREQQLAQEAARQEALRRRTERYGV